MAKRSPEENRAIYERRNEIAQSKGFESYSDYRAHQRHAEYAESVPAFANLPDIFKQDPGMADLFAKGFTPHPGRHMTESEKEARSIFLGVISDYYDDDWDYDVDFWDAWADYYSEVAG